MGVVAMGASASAMEPIGKEPRLVPETVSDTVRQTPSTDSPAADVTGTVSGRTVSPAAAVTGEGLLRPLSADLERMRRGGREVALAFDASGALTITDSAVPSGGAVPAIRVLASDPALSDDGRSFAVSLSGYSQNRASLWVDGRALPDGSWLDSEPTFNARGDLFWIRRDFTRRRPRRARTRIFMLPHDGLQTASLRTVTLPALVSKTIRWGDDVLAVGYHEKKRRYVAYRLHTKARRPRAELLISQETPLVVRDGQLFSVEMTGNIHRHLWSLFAASGRQSHEPMLFSDNRYGRLSWHQNNRLRLYARLAENTQDPEIVTRLNRMAGAVLDLADAQGRFPATKYSIDRSTALPQLVLDGSIHSSLWNGYASFDPALQARLRESTLSLVQAVEPEWDGTAYLRPSHPQLSWSGVLPHNQQNILGTVMAQYTLATGDRRFVPRLQDMREAFMREVFDTDGALSWRYWPDAHWMGNMPAFQRDRREDTGHASINAEFLMLANAAIAGDGRELELPPTTFQRGLSERLRFPRNITWDTSNYSTSLYWTPTVRWGSLPELASLYREWLMIPREDHDMQQIWAGYAEALPDVGALEGTLNIRRYRPSRDDNGKHGVSWRTMRQLEVANGVATTLNGRKSSPVQGLKAAVATMDTPRR